MPFKGLFPPHVRTPITSAGAASEGCIIKAKRKGPGPAAT